MEVCPRYFRTSRRKWLSLRPHLQGVSEASIGGHLCRLELPFSEITPSLPGLQGPLDILLGRKLCKHWMPCPGSSHTCG